MKQLFCNRCKQYLGEMERGRIKIDAVLICHGCNERIKIAENAMNTKINNCSTDSMPDFMKDIFKMDIN